MSTDGLESCTEDTVKS